ncbi:MAG: flagellin [Pseudotabrizicola sp.]|uniref:flagellin n=1 Tax=Pseudotabrizicola sp. TaxID=2939647 RepID=UPI00271C5CBA|nr:flagellin [Pseudotabrizicola sp.]MDO8882213.1 flagellin [Pseudotabrizicola sp.]MDP2082509.1 flagellin [Pseudotabrizicola sp.]MDZ7572815.1 flagellin [Pseudotabrizicola sp.]
MSSILTNNGAMVALQTMKAINKNMGQVQAEISTGKAVGNAKDNAAVWAISKTMESDVKGFKGISDSLSLGSSTIAVARSASEQITNLLTEIKGKIVASQEANVDRTKIQADVSALRDQIGSIVGAAQFNGLNLLSNNKTTVAYTAADNVDGSGKIDVLSSLDRSASGVASSSISVGRQDLSTTTAAVGTLTMDASAMTAAGTATANGAGTATYTINGDTTTADRTKAVMAGDSYSFDMATVFGGTFAAAATDKQTAIYTAKDGDTTADIAKGLADIMNFRLAEQGMSESFKVTVGGPDKNVVTVTNNTAADLPAAAAASDVTIGGGGKVGGGLALLKEIDVSTEAGAKAALGAIEGLTQTAIQAAADFGTAQKRIDVQQSFVSNLVDSLRSGIGSMVDANMEEASARLQALQVQQQLATQSLSIANQAPQSILSLFR